MTSPRIGHWMQTYTGTAFYPLDPHVRDIAVLDIAHSLSLLCRYGGHASEFYSVAEHCVLISETFEDRDLALWALLHDASEAYLGDMIRPLKKMMPEYQVVENRLMLVISERFGISLDEPLEVIEADTRILQDERAVLMKEPPQPWITDEQLQPLGITIQKWEPEEAEFQYLQRFWELTNGDSNV